MYRLLLIMLLGLAPALPVCAQAVLPQNYVPAGAVVQADDGRFIDLDRARVADGVGASVLLQGETPRATPVITATAFPIQLHPSTVARQVRVRVRESSVGRGKVNVSVVVNGTMADPAQTGSGSEGGQVFVVRVAPGGLEEIDPARLEIEVRGWAIGESMAAKIGEPPGHGPVDLLWTVDAVEAAVDVGLAVPFPETLARLSALWSTDGAEHSGPGTRVTRILDLSGRSQHALPTAGFDTGVYFPADAYGPDRVQFSVNVNTSPPQPSFDSATAASTTRYLAAMSPPLDTARDFSVVVWGRHRATVSYNGSSQRKPQSILFGSNTPDGLGVQRGVGIGTHKGRLRFQNLAHNDQLSADSPPGSQPCVFTQGPGTYFWVATHSGAGPAPAFMESYNLGHMTRVPRTVGIGDVTAWFNLGTSPAAGHLWAGDLYGIAVFEGALTATERTALELYGQLRWGTALSETKRVVYEGDSIMFGSFSTLNHNAPNLAAGSTADGRGYVNLAIPGGWIAGGPPLYPFVTRNQPLRNVNHPEQIVMRNLHAPSVTGLPSALVLAIGTNDLAVNLSGTLPDSTDNDSIAEAVAGAVRQYCNAARSLGFDPIFVCTLGDSSGPQPDTEISASKARVQQRIALLNARLVAGAPAGGYELIRFDLDPRIGPPGASLDSRYWARDQTHPNSGGYAVMAELIDAALAGGSPGPCVADFDQDGLVSPDDLDAFITGYFAGDPETDIDGDALVAPDDLDSFLTVYFDGCP
ncbi:MAG: SGNH/GDSL hydrolase family protein [Phycisphaerales bacterium]